MDTYSSQINPILVKAREASIYVRKDNIAWFDWANGQVWDETQDFDLWDAYENHAYRVLDRLVNR